MPITAQSIIHRCAEALQDKGFVRWTAAELVRHLNDGQREIATIRPDATSTVTSVALVAGARQTAPGMKLLDVERNTGGTKRAIRLVDRAILDAQLPSWQSMTGVTEIQHYMVDLRDPTAFYVYPPAASSGASVEVLYSAAPTDVAELADSAVINDVTGNIALRDIFANALMNNILFRAYSKDSENPANAMRAQAYYALFASALGVEAKATASTAPN